MSARRTRATRFLLVALLVVGSVVLAGLGVAVTSGPDPASATVTGPRLQLRGDLALPPGTGLGVARVRDGWIVVGRDRLVRLDETLAAGRTTDPAIPPEWVAKGYERLGDVAVSGDSVYVPFAQLDTARGRQAVGRFDARTLAFRDAVELPQHDITFVAVDGRAHVAYTMDRLDGDELLRYDIAHGWRPLAPLGLGRVIERVRGADVAAGAVWLSTDDVRHGVYRVDSRSGVVTDLGSAGHLDADVGGVDATQVGTTRLHVAVDDGGGAAALTGFAVAGGDVPGPEGEGRSGWPPVLVMGAVALLVAAGGASAVLVYRAWLGLRPRPRRT